MTFYATHDGFAELIQENAKIKKFETFEEVETFLKSAYPDLHETDEACVPVIGKFDDCWIKVHDLDTDDVDTLYEVCAPFTEQDGITIHGPGTHPGGNSHWITPRPDVYVAKILSKEDYLKLKTVPSVSSAINAMPNTSIVDF